MKKVILSLIFGGLLASTALATPISLAFVGISDSAPAVSGIVGGATSVSINTNTFSNLSCSGVSSSLCSTTASFTTGPVFSGTTTETFQLGSTVGSLVYTADASNWTVLNLGNGFFGIHTVGTYMTNTGLDATRGNLDLSFQNVQNGVSNFSASGGTVPEPGSMALLGSGLLGLGFIARRRATR